MAKPSIQNVSTDQTFQNWLDKTNEIVNIIKSDSLTASVSGDETIGDANLVGNFSSTNITATDSLSTDKVKSKTNNTTIDVQSPIKVTNATGPIAATFAASSGGRIRFTDNRLSWDMGLKNPLSADFIISLGVNEDQLRLTPAGTLHISNLVVDESVTAASYIGLDLDTSQIDEDPGFLYFTAQRARTASAGAFAAGNNISFGAPNSNGVISINYTPSGDSGGSSSGGDAATFGGLSPNQLLRSDQSDTMSGNLTVLGDVAATGNLISRFDASDIRLKKNITRIENAGDKVSTLNGYTFSYIKHPEERATGLRKGTPRSSI
jgi:hypothetical protein